MQTGFVGGWFRDIADIANPDTDGTKRSVGKGSSSELGSAPSLSLNACQRRAEPIAGLLTPHLTICLHYQRSLVAVYSPTIPSKIADRKILRQPSWHFSLRMQRVVSLPERRAEDAELMSQSGACVLSKRLKNVEGVS